MLRPEIQALRGAAVALVVIYHLWPGAATGGYVGVDVFFVISGFLITSHLLREVDRTGRLAPAAFWARRARRILPAALAVLLVCAAGTMVFVPQSDWPQFLAEVRASTAYVQNWQLAADAVSYAAESNGTSPVQHFWSLSAEEQFYLAWPLLILAALSVVPARRRRIAIGIAMATIAVLSLGYSIRATALNPDGAYFATPARAWEFAAGGLLAMLAPSGGGRLGIRCVVSWCGIAAMAAAALAYTDSTPFPGSAAMLPVLGALAVIWAGAPIRRWAPTPVLTLPPVQFLGGISYSVYLWHLPLLVFVPYAAGGGTRPETRIAILMLILLLAWLTKVLIEDPFRKGPFLAKRAPRWTFASVAAGTLLVAAVSASGSSYLQGQLRQLERATDRVLAQKPDCFGAAARDPHEPCTNAELRLEVVPTPLEARTRPNKPCETFETAGLVHECGFGVRRADAGRTVALIGDSHASHWRAALEVVAQAKRWHGISIARSGCPLSLATKDLRQPGDREECKAWNRAVLRWLAQHPEVATVFVSEISGSEWVAPAGQSEFAAAVSGFARAWAAVPGSVRRILVIRDTPKAEPGTAGCVERALGRGAEPGPACVLRRQDALDPDPAAVAATRLGSARVRLLDLTPFICDARRCYPVVGGALVHKDEHHLTAVFAETLGPYLREQVERAMPSASASRSGPRR
jgi:peptidoglycan/LPS O-acetylase OafA/YrhL